jgi:hypothetical protein
MRCKTKCALAALALCVLASVNAAAQGAQDLYSGSPELRLTLDAGMQSPFLGAQAAARIDRLGIFSLELGGGGGTLRPIFPTPSFGMFGSEGYQVHVNIGLTFLSHQRMADLFMATGIVGATATSTTYSGHYSTVPVHESHSIDLCARVEPTGILAVIGYDEDDMRPIYVIDPGYAFLLNPRYRYSYERHYLLGGSKAKAEWTFMEISGGPIFSPDFSMAGGLAEFLLGSKYSGLNFYGAFHVGVIARTGFNGELLIGERGDLENVSEMSAMNLSYMPIRVNLGVLWNLPLAKVGKEGEEK